MLVLNIYNVAVWGLIVCICFKEGMYALATIGLLVFSAAVFQLYDRLKNR